jgi:hypothetical protein
LGPANQVKQEFAEKRRLQNQLLNSFQDADLFAFGNQSVPAAAGEETSISSHISKTYDSFTGPSRRFLRLVPQLRGDSEPISTPWGTDSRHLVV